MENEFSNDTVNEMYTGMRFDLLGYTTKVNKVLESRNKEKELRERNDEYKKQLYIMCGSCFARGFNAQSILSSISMYSGMMIASKKLRSEMRSDITSTFGKLDNKILNRFVSDDFKDKINEYGEKESLHKLNPETAAFNDLAITIEEYKAKRNGKYNEKQVREAREALNKLMEEDGVDYADMLYCKHDLVKDMITKDHESVKYFEGFEDLKYDADSGLFIDSKTGDISVFDVREKFSENDYIDMFKDSLRTGKRVSVNETLAMDDGFYGEDLSYINKSAHLSNSFDDIFNKLEGYGDNGMVTGIYMVNFIKKYPNIDVNSSTNDSCIMDYADSCYKSMGNSNGKGFDPSLREGFIKGIKGCITEMQGCRDGGIELKDLNKLLDKSLDRSLSKRFDNALYKDIFYKDVIVKSNSELNKYRDRVKSFGHYTDDYGYDGFKSTEDSYEREL